jgi:beta-galactosidase
MTEPRIRLCREGVVLSSGAVVPLRAGSVHYWRLERRSWRRCLEAVRAMGLRLVDTYVPWGVHEVAPGVADFGERDPSRDVAAFLALAHEVGLYAIVRPGPHINAELTYFGLPERVVWDPACQARGPRGQPVLLPVPPRMFPVPSYASDAFLDEVTRWYELVGRVLAPLRHPEGPIVLAQIDNEGALYFRDGVYDQDYHPDAVRDYRAFLGRKYGSLAALDEPPRRFEGARLVDLRRHLDWAEAQEHLVASALGRYAAALRGAGLDGIPLTHNLPPGEEATPLAPAALASAVDLVGLDYYFAAAPRTRAIVARRTSGLAVRQDALGLPAFACEMGAGFPFYLPPLDERDSFFTLLAALAYGLRGFSVYMAVERDRWIGAPIDARGRARPFAERWRRLSEALETTDFVHLHREVPVRLVVPRLERRMARLLHAFGPVSGALLAVAGYGPREGAAEDDLGLGYAPAMETDTFCRAVEQALDARGIPYALVDGDDDALGGARWIVCATSGILETGLASALRAVADAGARVTLGPRPARFDEGLAPLGAEARAKLISPRWEWVEGSDPATVDQAVARAALALGLPPLACDPEGIAATLHADAAGVARVLFVLHTGAEEVVARVAAGLDATWHDVLDGEILRSERGALEIRIRPLSVRMLARA